MVEAEEERDMPEVVEVEAEREKAGGVNEAVERENGAGVKEEIPRGSGEEKGCEEVARISRRATSSDVANSLAKRRKGPLTPGPR